MNTLLSLKVFRAVVQNGSFTRAADQLGISVAMASKHVSHLENSVKAKLLHRNSRNLRLTEAGEEYYCQCSHALDTLETAAQKAAGGTEKPQGVLRMTMPQWFANPMFSNWLREYRGRHPEVRLDLVLDNRRVDLIAEGFDLALRISREMQPSLIVKPLAEIEFVLVATPGYLGQHGMPATPEEVNRHQAVLPSYTDIGRMTIRHRVTGATALLHLPPVMFADHTLMVGELIKAGCGIGYQPTWAVQQDLAAGRLVRLLPDYVIHTNQLYAVYVDRAFLSAKVRSFIDFISARIAEQQL